MNNRRDIPAMVAVRRAHPVAVLEQVGAVIRFFRDPGAPLVGKMLLVAAVAYILMPADAIPDLVPVVGWLDDVGVAMVAFAYLARIVRRYSGKAEVVVEGE